MALTIALLLGLLGAQAVLLSQSLDAELLDAAMKGNLEAVAGLLRKGANVNAANERGATALYIGAERGNLGLIKVLLEHGADPDTKDLEWGRTALRHASVRASTAAEKEARAEIIRLLVARGAGTEGESLVDLIRGNHIDAARTIVRRGGADPSYLALARAAATQGGHTDLADLLIKAGAKQPAPTDSLRSPERLKRWAGVYRSQSGQELHLAQGQHDDQLLLERVGSPRMALLSLDLTTFRSFDRSVVVTRKAGPLPSPSVMLRENGRTEVFSRTGAVHSAPTESSRAARPPLMERRSSAAAFAPVARSGDWPSFRGVAASGVAEDARPPTVWDVEAGTNVKWKVPIPGLGHSSPVVSGGRVFVTTAVPADESAVMFRHGRDAHSDVAADNRSTTDEVPYSWRVYALEKQSGKVLWERVAHQGVARTKRHVSQSQANSSPVTDGTHLIVWFGSEGLFCYGLDGTLLWKRDLGPLSSGYVVDPSYEWNTASSPIIYKHLVILQVDLLKDSFIAAFDIKTGKEVWRTARDEVPSWATPLLYDDPIRPEIVTVGPNYARGYDPATGKELWRLGKHSIYVAPTPIAGLGLIFVANGGGNVIQPIYAIKPGATGDITLRDDEFSNEHVVWSKVRGGPSTIPTPILYGDLLYVSSGRGSIVTAYVADTGERVYQERLAQGGIVSASPVAADGNLYFATEDGDVFVIKAGRRFERLAENKMGEMIMATPAISNEMIIFRTRSHLIALANGRPDE